jgi:hypothetical protein
MFKFFLEFLKTKALQHWEKWLSNDIRSLEAVFGSSVSHVPSNHVLKQLPPHLLTKSIWDDNQKQHIQTLKVCASSRHAFLDSEKERRLYLTHCSKWGFHHSCRHSHCLRHTSKVEEYKYLWSDILCIQTGRCDQLEKEKQINIWNISIKYIS